MNDFLILSNFVAILYYIPHIENSYKLNEGLLEILLSNIKKSSDVECYGKRWKKIYWNRRTPVSFQTSKHIVEVYMYWNVCLCFQTINWYIILCIHIAYSYFQFTKPNWTWIYYYMVWYTMVNNNNNNHNKILICFWLLFSHNNWRYKW